MLNLLHGISHVLQEIAYKKDEIEKERGNRKEIHQKTGKIVMNHRIIDTFSLFPCDSILSLFFQVELYLN